MESYEEKPKLDQVSGGLLSLPPENQNQGFIQRIQGLARDIFFSARTEVLAFPGWWQELSGVRKLGPLVGILLYWWVLKALGGLRSDHFTVGITILVLSYTGRLGAVLLRFLWPVLLTGILYDSQRFYSDFIRGPVHVREPYFFDQRFFGIHTAKGILTPNEWCQLHTHAILDFFAGFAYLFFISIFVLTNAYIYFWLARKGTARRAAQWIRERSPALNWAFFWVNIVGYSTYYWFAAAPPWYVALYGLGPAQMDARPNPAGCLRFDQILGTHFFTGMYGRSADVFGAIPSLHVAYPLISVYFAFRFGTMRVFSVCFYLWMCFSAVYLNHHYVLDILWGSSYALAAAWAMDFYFDRKAK